jgi:ATP-dependent exoDNAse (exonuclease V) beta subunit
VKPADHEHRERIRNDLSSTLVVEAAAGTGKTTVLVERILALFLEGRCRPRGLAALTFTEKAAGEMKLRVRERLESARDEHPNLEDVLGRLEEAQIATFHSFCTTCLQEYPVEAGVDVEFETLDQEESSRLFSEVFQLWLQQKLEDPPEGIRRYMRRRKGGYRALPAGPRLEAMAWSLCQWREFRSPWESPQVDRAYRIDLLVNRLRELNLLRVSARDRYHNYVKDTWALDWFLTKIEHQESVSRRDLDGLEAALAWLTGHKDFKKPRRGRGKAFGSLIDREGMLAEHEQMVTELTAFIDDCDAELVALLQQELLEAVDAYQEAKRRRGALDFGDLLLATRRLMVQAPQARQALQERYSHIFVDEFQDTDPVQAEILFLLAADSSTENDWQKVQVSPGKLFVVGDPKQSIYRFRRADVGMYYRVLAKLGKPLQLTTSFRSVPALQRYINTAFAEVMTGDRTSLQANYVPLTPYRKDDFSQPAVVALRVPVEHNYKKDVKEQTPIVVASFLDWMLCQSGWTVPDDEAGRRPVQASDICLLFRQMRDFGQDLTRAYIDELQARDIESLVVGGRSYHSREEVSTILTALEAMEWPQDELALFATLRGPLFAVDEQRLFQYRDRYRCLDMFRLPEEDDSEAGHLEPDFADIVEPLKFLAELHRRRNRRPVADTLAALLEFTRFYAALVLRPRGEQALANVLGLVERARAYDAKENLSFRGFVDNLTREAKDDARSEAPILEQSSDGVRMMTVHAAKGLEFPVVVLVVPGAALAHERPSRHVDSEKGLCLLQLGQMVPQQLAEVEAQESAIERAEGERLCYVAATRAKELLVFPGFDPSRCGEEWIQKSWLSPLWGPLKDEPCEAPYEGPMPKLEDFSQTPFVWCASGHFELEKHLGSGVRQDQVLVDLITKDVQSDVVEQGRTSFQHWQNEKRTTLEQAAAPSIVLKGPKEADVVTEGVVIARVEREPNRPKGPRFGTLIHAVLEKIALDATTDAITDQVHQQARLWDATEDETEAAIIAVTRALAHPLMDTARQAEQTLRESPITYRQADNTLISGIIDLAFKHNGVWTIVDFKTDEPQKAYLRQVAVYAQGVAEVTGVRAEGVLFLV